MTEHRTTDLMTPREVAAELRLSPLTVYRKISSGELAAVRIGEAGQLRVHRAAVDELLHPTGPEKEAA
jgi:excisionase family DNA binding protein